MGDSMLNGINENGFKLKNQKVKIKNHSGATSNDLIHYAKPIINKKPEMVISHCGTNDLQQNLKTVDNLKQIHDYTKANSPKTKLVISTIITRKDNIELDKKS